MVRMVCCHGMEFRVALNDAKVKAAKPRDTAYKLADAGQLFLHVTPAGGRHWRMNYTFGRNAAGRPAQKTLSFGSYPSMSLAEARERRDKAKAQLNDGHDPAVVRRVEAKSRAAANENTFQLVAERWFQLKTGWNVARFRDWCGKHDRAWTKADAHHWIDRPGGWSLIHAGDVLRSLDRDVFPLIGDLPIAALDSPKILEVLNDIARRGAIETAHRVCQRISDVFIYAIPAGLAKVNPAASMTKALQKKPRSRKQPSIVDGIKDNNDRIRAARQMMIDCEAERCRAITKFALRLSALTALRPNEIQGAAWEEFELDGPEPTWIIPSARMKGDEERKAEEFGDHVVPLARQTVEMLLVLRRLTGHFKLLFPGEKHVHQPISADTVRHLLIRGGYRGTHVPHGFRAMFSTIMNELPGRQPGDRAVLDLMLAHVPKDRVEGAYNRAAYMPRRRQLAQEWADVLMDGFWPAEIHIGQPIRHGTNTRTGR